jgi:hypothetical protein
VNAHVVFSKGAQRLTLPFALILLLAVAFSVGAPSPRLTRAGILDDADLQSTAHLAQPLPGELLVKFRDDVSEDRAQWVLAQVGALVMDAIVTIRLYRVRIAEDDKLTKAIISLQGFGEVEYVERNVLDSVPMTQ